METLKLCTKRRKKTCINSVCSIARDMTEVQKEKKVKEFTNQLHNLHKIFLCLKEAKAEF